MTVIFFQERESAKTFERNFSEALINNKENDVITMWESKSIKSHFQSYFLCFSKKVFNSKIYTNFWKNYIPLSYRYHAIYNGEIALSQNVLNKFNNHKLYNSDMIINNILKSKIDNNFSNIFEYLPYIICNDLNFNKRYFILNKIELKRLVCDMEKLNPSHIYALLNIKFNNSPFLKKDIIKANSFRYSDIEKFMNDLEFTKDNKLKNQILIYFKKSHQLFINN